MNSLEKHFEKFRKNTIGYNYTFRSPYGEKKIVYKIKDVKSVRKLIIKTKKKKGNKYLDFTFSASKTDIDGATSLSALSNSGKDIAIKLPVTIVLTGNNSNDTEKGGQVWIIPASVNMVYKKKKDTKATGKLQK